jgi:hypothetical protein
LVLLNKYCITAMFTNIDNDDRTTPCSGPHFSFARSKQEVLKSGSLANFDNQVIELLAGLVTTSCLGLPGRLAIFVYKR